MSKENISVVPPVVFGAFGLRTTVLIRPKRVEVEIPANIFERCCHIIDQPSEGWIEKVILASIDEHLLTTRSVLLDLEETDCRLGLMYWDRCGRTHLPILDLLAQTHRFHYTCADDLSCAHVSKDPLLGLKLIALIGKCLYGWRWRHVLPSPQRSRVIKSETSRSMGEQITRGLLS